MLMLLLPTPMPYCNCISLLAFASIVRPIDWPPLFFGDIDGNRVDTFLLLASVFGWLSPPFLDFFELPTCACP